MAIIKTYLEIHKRSDGQWVDPWPSLLHTNFVIGFNWLHSVLLNPVGFAWVTVFEIKSFESKMSLISEFEFLIFSLFESIALCVYLKKDYSA